MYATVNQTSGRRVAAQLHASRDPLMSIFCAPLPYPTQPRNVAKILKTAFAAKGGGDLREDWAKLAEDLDYLSAEIRKFQTKVEAVGSEAAELFE